MTTPAITVTAETTVEELARLLLSKQISAVPVVDAAGILIGIVSEGDLMRRKESGTERKSSWWLSLIGNEPDAGVRAYIKTHGRRAGDVMSAQVRTVTAETPLEDIASTLEKHRIKRVPVVDEAGTVIGIISRANLLHGLTVRKHPGHPVEGDQALREALLAEVKESGIDAHLITIVVTDGVADLWGMVQTEDEQKALRVAVENSPGLKGADNQVGVFPTRFLTTA